MENSQSDSNIFSVRIVSIDYYMAPPIPDIDICYSSFQGGKVDEVPIIRIYGSTPAGQKTCLHVHRALPYLYVPCSDISLETPKEGDIYLHTISCAIEKALKLKGCSGSKRQHVHGCTLVRGRKFYGYHSAEDLFIKIYLYYPHEVARVAALLLGGAVLDKSFQPHESHIPYLLQFLVDYNLYGMGHLHISKLKFRHPLPDDFIPRAARHSGKFNLPTEKLTCVNADFQADSGTDACLGSPIWTSSTIPCGWMWPIPVEHDSSLDWDLHLIKRQSTCELEGDATVDEILNQQCKIYSSLSQTRSEVKMVQSLIPIWEEEYERTGLHKEMIDPDPNKPLPENVLKTLSHGYEFENALLDLCGEAENLTSSHGTPLEKSEIFLQSIKSLNEVGNLVEFLEHANPDCSDGESSEGFDKRNRKGSVFSQKSLLEQDDGAIPTEQRNVSPERGPVDEAMLISEKIETSDPKVIDVEALGLLRWLASSQAAEDLNTDDELVHNIILSPLLPTATIDEVLEKANLDYECESQQECQDILDSVENINDSEALKEETTGSTGDICLPQTSSENKIPQVDGLCDDQLMEHVGNSSEIGMNNELERSSHQGLQCMHIDLSSERQRNKNIWGSLPFSMQQKVYDGSESSSFNLTDTSNEMKSSTRPSSSSVNEVQKLCDDLMANANKDSSGLKEGNKLIGCSMRDLMRRKRSYRVEPSENGTSEFKKIFLGTEQEETTLNPKQLEFQMMQNDVEAMLPTKTSVNPLVTDQRAAADVQSSCATCVPEVSSKVYGVEPAYCNFPMYGKLSLSSCNDSSLQVSTLKNEPSCFHERPDEFVCARVRAESESITMSDPSLLLTETREVPTSLNSVKQDTVLSTALYESDSCSHCFIAPFDKNSQGFCTAIKKLPEMPSNRHENTNTAIDVNALQMENCVIEKQGMQTCMTSPRSSLSRAIITEKRPVEYIEMTFSKKPPTTDQMVGTSEYTSFAAAVHNHTFIVDMGNSDRTLGFNSNLLDFRWRGADKILPFFANSIEDERVYDKPYKNKVLNFHQETVLGLPAHYRIDGSFLYLLTTVLSPPSVDSVCKWLSHLAPQNTIDDATGSSRGSIHSALLGQPSTKHNNNNSGFVSKENNSLNDGKTSSEAKKLDAILSGDIINSQGFLINACPGTIPESESVPHVKPSLDQLSRENHKNLNTEVDLCHNEVTTELYIEESKMEDNECTKSWQDISQISGPDVRSKLTPLSQIGFRDPASVGAGQQLTLLSIEVQAESRGDLRPDPRFDAINVIALAIQEDNGLVLEAFVLLRGNDEESCQRNLDGISGCQVIVAYEEKHLFNHFLKIVRSFDPDILMGWEIQGGSLGFLAERAAHLGIVLLNNISRTPSETKSPARNSETLEKGIPDDQLPQALMADSIAFEDAIIEDEWGRTHGSGVHVGGRIVLNIWRLMRSEVKLNMYTIEAVAEEVLRRKIPSIPFRILTQWFSSGPRRARFRCINYVFERAKLNLEIMNQLDMINRTSELARVFGIDFFSVLSRGSQYRVESMFLRLAHSQNYLAISPGNQQVASQPAMECLPLVMEPESGFYVDPVVVLDFQSLYPSMIIAYNLCFCTCLGKVVPSKANTLGVSSFFPDPRILIDLKHQILLTPNGVMYVPSEVRKGVLPRLLEEILSTRIMVKQAMKKLKPSQQVLSKIFNARQLALKLIANVTYGYTAAGFSGRMPCAELADSIVQCGRRTLEKAISFVNSHDKWNARVIYGDTDSMFVLLKGRTMEESFKIGQEIASEVTLMNPNPVTLKMEKVYHPCFLLTKKRYVGYSYENPDQAEPSFDAKGIETVRRDGCGAVAKTLERSLRLFFKQQDIFKVKEYLQRQWSRILGGKVSLQDFVFAKEVRLGTYSTRVSSLPPAAIVATKAMRADPRAEPRYAERIPYVVIHGEPGARLVDMVVDPLDLLRIDSPFRLNDLYYIKKQIIPALQRVFGLVGADLNQWFLEMPRPVRPTVAKRHFYASNGQRTRIDNYYLSKHCILCGELVQASTHLCDKCSRKGPAVATAVTGRTSKLERNIHHLAAICRHCGGGDWIVESGVKCTSLACTVFFERRKVQKELQILSAVATEAGFYPRCMVEWF